jgi:hypothetical protein
MYRSIHTDTEAHNMSKPVADQIIAAYLELCEDPQDWIRLARIRPLVNAPRKDVDKTLVELMYTGLVHLAPESNTKTHKPEDREAAIRVGGENLHILCIEEEFFQPTR